MKNLNECPRCGAKWGTVEYMVLDLTLKYEGFLCGSRNGYETHECLKSQRDKLLGQLQHEKESIEALKNSVSELQGKGAPKNA